MPGPLVRYAFLHFLVVNSFDKMFDGWQRSLESQDMHKKNKEVQDLTVFATA